MVLLTPADSRACHGVICHDDVYAVMMCRLNILQSLVKLMKQLTWHAGHFRHHVLLLHKRQRETGCVALQLSTVLGYLADVVGWGHTGDAAQLAADAQLNEQTATSIATAIRQCGVGGLGAVKAALPAEVGYGQIKVVAALMAMQALWFTGAQGQVQGLQSGVQDEVDLPDLPYPPSATRDAEMQSTGSSVIPGSQAGADAGLLRTDVPAELSSSKSFSFCPPVDDSHQTPIATGWFTRKSSVGSHDMPSATASSTRLHAANLSRSPSSVTNSITAAADAHSNGNSETVATLHANDGLYSVNSSGAHASNARFTTTGGRYNETPSGASACSTSSQRTELSFGPLVHRPADPGTAVVSPHTAECSHAAGQSPMHHDSSMTDVSNTWLGSSCAKPSSAAVAALAAHSEAAAGGEPAGQHHGTVVPSDNISIASKRAAPGFLRGGLTKRKKPMSIAPPVTTSTNPPAAAAATDTTSAAAGCGSVVAASMQLALQHSASPVVVCEASVMSALASGALTGVQLLQKLGVTGQEAEGRLSSALEALLSNYEVYMTGEHAATATSVDLYDHHVSYQVL